MYCSINEYIYDTYKVAISYMLHNVDNIRYILCAHYTKHIAATICGSYATYNVATIIGSLSILIKSLEKRNRIDESSNVRRMDGPNISRKRTAIYRTHCNRRLYGGYTAHNVATIIMWTDVRLKMWPLLYDTCDSNTTHYLVAIRYIMSPLYNTNVVYIIHVI